VEIKFGLFFDLMSDLGTLHIKAHDTSRILDETHSFEALLTLKHVTF
jgi:hypothetical protein